MVALALQTLKGHASTVWCTAFSADGNRLVSVSDDRSMRLWCFHRMADLAQLGYPALKPPIVNASLRSFASLRAAGS